MTTTKSPAPHFNNVRSIGKEYSAKKDREATKKAPLIARRIDRLMKPRVSG